MTPPIRERLADTITGGSLTAARQNAENATAMFNEVLAETRRLSRDLETVKEGGILSEDYAGRSWTSRLDQDRHWQLISGYAQHRLIEKPDVDLYHDLLNYAYTFSPLVRGAIDLKTQYTFGLSYSIQTDNEANEKIIKAIQNDPKNKVAFFGSQATIETDRDLQKGGNIFIAIWIKANPVQIRVWSTYEIGAIITDPEDSDLPMYYVRSWQDANGPHTKAYPSIYNSKYAGVIQHDGNTYEVNNNVLVYHVAEGKGLKQRWALSPYTAALPWNRAYEEFLTDFAAIVRMIRKYTSMFTTTGGDAQVNALQEQFSHEQHGHHKNQVGDQLITTEGNDFKVIDAGSNKIVGLSDSRQYLIQFCTAVKVPENMLTGNPQTGNRASAQELATNFLPVIEERQTFWADALKAIFAKILGNEEFEISFPPLRSQDALTYLQGLVTTATLGTGIPAGVIRPVDLIKAVYESLDLKLPPDTEIDDMAAMLLDKMYQSPQMATAIDRLAAAATRLQEAIPAT